MWTSIAAGLLLVTALYAAFVLLLLLLGRGADARASARFVPDCARLLTRLSRDPRLSSRRKWMLVGLAAYLALPFDLIPDFVPVLGALDDAILVAFAVRSVFREAGPELLQEHWPGPRQSLDLVLRLAGATR